MQITLKVYNYKNHDLGAGEIARDIVVVECEDWGILVRINCSFFICM